MTKQEWLEVRDKPDIPLGVWFECYHEQGGFLYVEDFEKVFNALLRQESVVADSHGNLKQITLDGARGRLTKYFDSKFGV